MSTPKRGDARDTIVKQNCHLFRRILQAKAVQKLYHHIIAFTYF